MPPGIHPRGLLIRIHLASLHFDIQEGNKKYNVSSSFWLVLQYNKTDI